MNTSHLPILTELHRLGVEVEVRGERLHLDAPAGLVTPELIQRATLLKPAILKALNTPSSTDTLPIVEPPVAISPRPRSRGPTLSGRAPPSVHNRTTPTSPATPTASG